MGVTSLLLPGHVARAVASMAAKNKQRKKAKSKWKVANKYTEKDVGAENSGEEEEADSGNAKDENKDEELSLDEVFHLGGTRVSF